MCESFSSHTFSNPPAALFSASEAVILFAQCVLIAVAGLFRRIFRIVDRESCGIPLLHRNHGMIVVGQTLLSPDFIYPVVDSPPVVAQKLVKILLAHDAQNLYQRGGRQWMAKQF